MSKSKISKKYLNNLTQIVISAFFPLTCLVCGVFITQTAHGEKQPDNNGNKRDDGPRSIQASFEKEMKPYLCSLCMAKFVPVTPPVCTCCGKMFKSREGVDRICEQCLNKNPKKNKIGMIRSVGIYDTVLMDLIRTLKYNGKIQLAKPFGNLLYKVFLENWKSHDMDKIVPVPLHNKRARERGFNQSGLMLKHWPAGFRNNGVIVLMDRGVLARKKWTQPQIGLSRSQRKENIKGAFEVMDQESVISKKILLVDDVYTTGATLNECARTLFNAGAQSVDALTLARAL